MPSEVNPQETITTPSYVIAAEKNTLTSAPPTAMNFTSDTVTRDTTIGKTITS